MVGAYHIKRAARFALIFTTQDLMAVEKPVQTNACCNQNSSENAYRNADDCALAKP